MSRSIYETAQLIPASPPPTEPQPATPQPATPQSMPQPSLLRTLLNFFGWLLILTLVLVALVTLISVWLMSSTARDLLNLDTQTTIVSGQAVVESIKQVNKQILVEHYNVVDIDYTEAPQGWLRLLGMDQSFVLLLKGRVPAGFDLSQLQASDVWVSRDGRRVQLVLPPPEIFVDNVNIDFEESRILAQRDTCPDFLCQNQLTVFQEQLMPEGRQLLIAAAQRSGILTQVANDGVRYYEGLLKALGFAEVRVVIREDDG
ncbi:MAG: DUF4230 domain-containing protein [Caldilineaceae bacterium]|nr:DUF4230 domain-containing protein [Caldilineaceae bacterium]